MRQLVLIAVGGSLGALSRHFLGSLVLHRFGLGFPYGTLVVNIVGCFLIGLIVTLAAEHSFLPSWAPLFLVVGFLGSFTTYSAFSMEIFAFLEAGEWGMGLFYVGSSILLGLFALWFGTLIVR